MQYTGCSTNSVYAVDGVVLTYFLTIDNLVFLPTNRAQVKSCQERAFVRLWSKPSYVGFNPAQNSCGFYVPY